MSVYISKEIIWKVRQYIVWMPSEEIFLQSFRIPCVVFIPLSFSDPLKCLCLLC